MFAVGLLEFRHRAWHNFPQRNRRDVEIATAFRKRGVPAEQIVTLIDQEATLTHIQQRFRETLARVRPGDTLFLYYQGHGWRENDRFYWVPWDGYENDTLWDSRSWMGEVERSFRGRRLIVASDCCYSGFLRYQAAVSTSRVAWGALASTDAEGSSTVNWTFTDCFIEAILGNPIVDSNGDGVISFDEIHRFVGREMDYFEEQDAGGAASRRLNKDTPLFRTTRTVRPGEGRLVEVRDGRSGEWKRGRLLRRSGNLCLVAWPGTYENERQQWVESALIR